jgi:hypothetical protein
VKNRFQSLPFKCNLQRYTTEGIGYGVLKNITLDERVDECVNDTIAAASTSSSSSASKALEGEGVKSVQLVGGRDGSTFHHVIVVRQNTVQSTTASNPSETRQST